MVEFSYRVDSDALSQTGFAQGQLCVGKNSTSAECFETMVLLTASLLLDQVMQWLDSGAKVLDFNPIDQGAWVRFIADGDTLKVKTTKASFTASLSIFLEKVLQESERLCAECRLHLPATDAGREDLEYSLEKYRRWLSLRSQRASPQ